MLVASEEKTKKILKDSLVKYMAFVFRASELSLQSIKKKKKEKNCFRNENNIYKIQSPNTYVLVSHISFVCFIASQRVQNMQLLRRKTYTIPKYSHSFLHHVKLFPNRSFY